MRRLSVFTVLALLAMAVWAYPFTGSNIGLVGAFTGGISAPTMVQIILQGQDAQGANEDATHGDYTISEPNHQWVGWESVAGASEYLIYRSVVSTPGATPSYSYYATITDSSAASNYSAYVSNSTWTNSSSNFSGGPFYYIAQGINRVWEDTAATGAASGTAGPTSGYFYAVTGGYTYTVVAVVGGVDSAQSSPSILPLFENGQPVCYDGVFNNGAQLTFASANPGSTTTPLGFSNSVYVQLNNGTPDTHYVNPFTGACGPQYNVSLAGFNYIVINIYPVGTWTSQSFVYDTEINDDYTLYYPNTDISLPSVPTAGQWNTFKLPLGGASGFLVPETNSAAPSSTWGIQQNSYYKTTESNFATGTLVQYYLEVYATVN